MANKITVTSLGTTANVNATPDSARYYSDKSKEWAISDKLIDNEDYSSKYYANESKKQADISTAKATEVVESGNNAVSNIESARDNAITDITNQESLSVDNVNTAGATQIALATEQANIAKEQATIATNKTSEVVASGNTALNNIDTAKSSAMTDITNLKNTSVSNITTAKNNAITTITTQETTSKNNVVATGNAQVERVNLTGVDNRTPMFTKGEKETNEGVYQNVYDLKHSTFDKSKFTVVGSPTITNDGIATGVPLAYLTSPDAIDLSSADSWEIKFRSSSGNNMQKTPFSISTSDQNGIMIDEGDLYMSSGNGWDLALKNNIIPKDGNMYYVKLGFTGTQYYAENSTDGINYTNVWTNNTTTKTDANTVVMLLNWTYDIGMRYFDGQFDLKQFSITVDGKEVFNGNKTGIDVIKADNYEVVGSPVITDDGVASGFTANNYIKATLNNITYNDEFKLCLKANFGADQNSTNLMAVLNAPGTTDTILVYKECRSNNRQIVCKISVNGKTIWQPYVSNLSFNTEYNIELTLNQTNYTLSVFDTNGILVKSHTILALEGTIVPLTNLFIGGGTSYSAFDNSIDLNSFKIYVDGNLVYQPCLKIPYTQSKTGSQIVDVAYRDRVIDLYEQEGQAGYYTIDEDNKNFTLPMGEIYGMIGQRSLISSTVTETNRVDIYSDKTCLICGNVATAGTINLPIELVNKNYFITLPTSAKTATSFTTTATGDYILIGKVI